MLRRQNAAQNSSPRRSVRRFPSANRFANLFNRLAWAWDDLARLGLHLFASPSRPGHNPTWRTRRQRFFRPLRMEGLSERVVFNNDYAPTANDFGDCLIQDQALQLDNQNDEGGGWGVALLSGYGEGGSSGSGSGGSSGSGSGGGTPGGSGVWALAEPGFYAGGIEPESEESEAQYVDFWVHFSDLHEQGASVQWNTEQVLVEPDASNSAATSDVDFASASGTITIPAGVATLSTRVRIPIHYDGLLEANEWFKLRLSQPTNDSTIIEDEQLAHISDVTPIPKKNIWLNDNDNNENIIDDREDFGIEDEDLKPVSWANVIPTWLTPQSFRLSYDLNTIRLWDSPSKDNLVVSGDAGEGLGLPRVQFTGQPVWVEGMLSGLTTINVYSFEDGSASDPESWGFYMGQLEVMVWKLDLDVDSDNNNGFNYPENSFWEEYLEDHDYAIGKMLSVGDSHFTPMRLRLPTGLDVDDPDILVRIDGFTGIGGISAGGTSGTVRLWNTYKADPNRSSVSVHEGGNLVGEVMSDLFTLRELKYDPASGGVTIWMEATSVTDLHDTKREVDDNGKPDDRWKVTIEIEAGSRSDEVKYMVVHPGSFYPVLNDSQTIRNAFSAQLVYGGGEANDPPTDDPRWTMKRVTKEELEKILDRAIAEGRLTDDPFPNGESAVVKKNRILTILFQYDNPGPNPIPGTVPGLGAGLYKDHVSGKYVLAFRGTNFTELHDWIANLSQLISGYHEQYEAAALVSRDLRQAIGLLGLQISGHSLGGGLASAGALVAGVHADTFNAAGLVSSTVVDPNSGSDWAYGASARYASAGDFIDTYGVWWWGARPDGTRDTPDILSFLQNYMEHNIGGTVYLPDAVGQWHPLDGLLNFTDEEAEFVARLSVALGSTSISDWAPILLAIFNVNLDVLGLGLAINIDPEAESALRKMIASHSMESVFYGLMHGNSGGVEWNVYDVPAPGVGGPQ